MKDSFVRVKQHVERALRLVSKEHGQIVQHRHPPPRHVMARIMIVMAKSTKT